VSAWRVSLEERHLGSSSIIIRMSAIRKLAAEAGDSLGFRNSCIPHAPPLSFLHACEVGFLVFDLQGRRGC
jgi:hypothetical protein